MARAIFGLLHRAHAIVIFLLEIRIGHFGTFDEDFRSRLREQHAFCIFDLGGQLLILDGIRGHQILAEEFALDQFIDDLFIWNLVFTTALIDFLCEDIERGLADRLAIHGCNHITSGDDLGLGV